MVVETERLPFESLTRVAERLAAGVPTAEALELIAAAVLESTGARLAVVRVLDERENVLVARAVAPVGSPQAAELSGSKLEPAFEAGGGHTVVPARAGGRVVGAIELVGDVDATGFALAGMAAAQLALALRLLPGSPAEKRMESLRRAGEALEAGAELERAARHAAREAAEATGAQTALVWRGRGDRLELLAADGLVDVADLERARTFALEARSARNPVVVEPDAFDTSFVSIRLGEPAFGVLQLRYDFDPPQLELDALAEFGARVAHTLRLGVRARDIEVELDRTRALVSVVGDAISRLSLTHTLETAVDRFAALLAIDRVGIYLRDERRLVTAAARGLGGPHEDVAEELLALAIGPLRARDTIEVPSETRDPALGRAARALGRAGFEAALVVPLRAHDETIGLLVAYPGSRGVSEAEHELLAALASQLAVAVQNARLHEEAMQLSEALGAVLESEREAARRLSALYEISRAITRNLSIESTLAAITETIVAVLGVDAAAIRVPDERSDLLVPGAVHIADDRLAELIRTIMERPQPRMHLTQPLVLDVETARRVGGAHALLVPFLVKGSTAVVVPISTQLEMLAHLTIVSLDPGAPISAEMIATATTIAAQAALALDNARLYQQQKAFAETIQRALLPGEHPTLAGFDIGAVYESAARLDVGGDVYDFVELGTGRVAVVLGDVTGHGVDATADMAMAKFVFRSLAREHPEPGDFLAHANDVIAGEIALGKFITMAYLALDKSGRFTCASAGHPAPRLVLADGTVETVPCGGLALGIESDQSYAQTGGKLPRGAAVVLYTDGVVEARSGAELYGVERLDACLTERIDLPAQSIAAAVLADCRAFAGGELRDDCAVVVAKRL